jgi:hypothetical protein
LLVQRPLSYAERTTVYQVSCRSAFTDKHSMKRDRVVLLRLEAPEF